jgi:hypothetical protein
MSKVVQVDNSIILCVNELRTIFNQNYSKDEIFKKELLSVLKEKTGSGNLGILCLVAIDGF